MCYEGQVAQIILGPAPGNILDESLIRELSSTLKELESPGLSSLKLILIQGAGKHFSFGASVEEHLPGQVDSMLPAFHNLIHRILRSPVPTLANVRGVCLGGGFELSLACSLFFCEESSSCGVPEIQLGVFPPPAAALLPFKTTQAVSNEMILSGKRFSGIDLKNFGIANGCAPKEELDTLVKDFIEGSILPHSAASLRIAHRAAQMSIDSHFEHFIGRLEALYLKELMGTEDAKEGLNSFLQKREPQWKDR